MYWISLFGNVGEVHVVLVIFTWQRFGMDTVSDTQHLRDEFHEVENQMGILQKELTETQQQLADEKRNSETVRCFNTAVFYLLCEIFKL